MKCIVGLSLIFTFIGIGSAFSKEPKWMFLDVSQEDTCIFYGDVNNIIKDGKNISAWVMMDCQSRKQMNDKDGYYSSLIYYKFFCDYRRGQILSVTNYVDHKGEGRVHSSNANPMPPENIVPGSILDNIYEGACKL